jgi:class 3 adenylate cyclase
VHQIKNVEKIGASFLKAYIPTKISGHEAATWIIVFLLLILWRISSRLKDYFFSNANMPEKEREEKIARAMQRPAEDGRDAEKLNPEDGKSRAELLKVMATAKKKLDSLGRDLAFLAIDVVGSTEMKVNEDKSLVEYDFREFKKFVESKMIAQGALKSAWTPDGVMMCFPSIDAAVRTAQEVISGLDAFNKNVKTIRKDFHVRCGINAGHVYFDEATPMEEMSDRVIDVAGHMQKHAQPGTIAIAKPAIEPMQERDGFKPTGKVIDGYDVYHWEKD